MVPNPTAEMHAKVIDQADVDFDVHAIAAAWEAADELPVCVAASIVNAFTSHTVSAADGFTTDGDVVFGDSMADGILVEEKAVGVCDTATAEHHAPGYIPLPDHDHDDVVLAVNPNQIFD